MRRSRPIISIPSHGFVDPFPACHPIAKGVIEDWMLSSFSSLSAVLNWERIEPNVSRLWLPGTQHYFSEPSSTPDENRQPSPSPLPGFFVEATWQSRIAEGTATTLIKVVASKLVPIALDEHLTTRPAIGRVVFQVVNVADINVSQSGGERLFAGADERLGRGCRDN